jgi:hypothetical protein
MEKVANILATSVIFDKIPKVKIVLLGENSPHPVTLVIIKPTETIGPNSFLLSLVYFV